MYMYVCSSGTCMKLVFAPVQLQHFIIRNTLLNWVFEWPLCLTGLQYKQHLLKWHLYYKTANERLSAQTPMLRWWSFDCHRGVYAIWVVRSHFLEIHSLVANVKTNTISSHRTKNVRLIFIKCFPVPFLNYNSDITLIHKPFQNLLLYSTYQVQYRYRTLFLS